jgi:hypothetical protein
MQVHILPGHPHIHMPIIVIIFSGDAAKRRLWPPRPRGFLITHNDVPQSVGLLWTSDQLVAETSTWQHTTHTTDRHPCPRWDSNPRSQQAQGRRSTARPLGPAHIQNYTLKNKLKQPHYKINPNEIVTKISSTLNLKSL